MEHICERVKAKKALWFKQGSTTEVVETEDNEFRLDLVVKRPGVRGRDFDERDVPNVLT